MTCPRCLGLMVASSFPFSSDGEIGIPSAWRCTICGEMVDPVILRNRGTQDNRRGAFWRKKRVVVEEF